MQVLMELFRGWWLRALTSVARLFWRSSWSSWSSPVCTIHFAREWVCTVIPELSQWKMKIMQGVLQSFAVYLSIDLDQPRPPRLTNKPVSHKWRADKHTLIYTLLRLRFIRNMYISGGQISIPLFTRSCVWGPSVHGVLLWMCSLLVKKNKREAKVRSEK